MERGERGVHHRGALITISWSRNYHLMVMRWSCTNSVSANNNGANHWLKENSQPESDLWFDSARSKGPEKCDGHLGKRCDIPFHIVQSSPVWEHLNSTWSAVSPYFIIATHAVSWERRCSQTDSHGKLLKGAWAHSLSCAEAAGLSESCKEQRWLINSAARGPGPAQAAPTDMFRWT